MGRISMYWTVRVVPGIPPARPLELYPDDDITGGFARALGDLARE